MSLRVRRTALLAAVTVGVLAPAAPALAESSSPVTHAQEISAEVTTFAVGDYGYAYSLSVDWLLGADGIGHWTVTATGPAQTIAQVVDDSAVHVTGQGTRIVLDPTTIGQGDHTTTVAAVFDVVGGPLDHGQLKDSVTYPGDASGPASRQGFVWRSADSVVTLFDVTAQPVAGYSDANYYGGSIAIARQQGQDS